MTGTSKNARKAGKKAQAKKAQAKKAQAKKAQAYGWLYKKVEMLGRIRVERDKNTCTAICLNQISTGQGSPMPCRSDPASLPYFLTKPH